MSTPIAALAIVLAITIRRALPSASGGRSVTFVLARNRASFPAIAQPVYPSAFSSARYRNDVLPPEARQDLMFVMSGTRRMWPLRNVGSLTYDTPSPPTSTTCGSPAGTEADVIAEAHLDPDSISPGQRFAQERSDAPEPAARTAERAG